MFAAPWGLVAQGSGQLRILPLGTSRWQTVHEVTGGSLYRIAFDDAGRLLAWWESEPHFHLFAPRTKGEVTFPLPPPPSPEFKYGYGIEDMYFTAVNREPLEHPDPESFAVENVEHLLANCRGS